MKVKDFMVNDVVTIPSVCTMDDVKNVFSTSHEAWPVMNMAGNLCGVIPKSVLVVILKHRAFYKKTR